MRSANLRPACGSLALAAILLLPAAAWAARRSPPPETDAGDEIAETAPPELQGGGRLLAPDDPRAKEGTLVETRGLDPGWKDSRVAERAPNILGQTGLLHINSARVGKSGYFDLAFHGSYFDSPDFILEGVDPNTLALANFAFGVTLLDLVEVGVATRSSTNQNELGNPKTSFATGDFFPSAKIGYAALPWAVGLDLRAQIPSATGAVGVAADNFALVTTGLATLDLYGAGTAPLRLHVNAGWAFQNANNVAAVEEVYATLNDDLLAFSATQWFYDQLLLGVGVEAPLPWVDPFLEVGLQAPLGVPAGAGDGANAVVVTPGLRFSIGRGLHADVGIDLGVAGTEPFPGRPVTPPWQAQLGVSYTFSPFLPETQVQVREKARAVGTVAGCVQSAESGQPLQEAYVEFVGTSGPRIVVGDDGCYASLPLDVGQVTLRIRHPDFKAQELPVEIHEKEVAKGDASLDPAPRYGKLKGVVINEKDQRVDAELVITNSAGKSVTVGAPEGGFNVRLAPGRYQVLVRADGYLNQGKPVTIEPNGQVLGDFLLKEVPKNRAASLKTGKIEITTKIPFETGSARLLRSAPVILDDVLDVILRNPTIAKFRVEGHTDNQGGEEYNQTLSEERARSVLEYLVQNGVPAGRLEARGYGLTRPIASNATEDGRARNRRVEFVIPKQAEEP